MILEHRMCQLDLEDFPGSPSHCAEYSCLGLPPSPRICAPDDLTDVIREQSLGAGSRAASSERPRPLQLAWDSPFSEPPGSGPGRRLDAGVGGAQ